MKLSRVRHHDQVWLARIDNTTDVVLLQRESEHPSADALREASSAGTNLRASGTVIPLEEVRLLAPVANPGKILAIALNYADHARESNLAPPANPVIFSKAVTSIIGPGDSIRYRRDLTTEVDYEAELAVVIGRQARNIAEKDALDHVLGYTIMNDVSARDLQFGDKQWVRGKSLDTFAPIGPWLVTRDDITDPQQLSVQARVNGQLVQDGNTSDMLFSVAEIIAYLSRSMTLQPGDVIATGTPYGVGFARTPQLYLLDKDEVCVDIELIGTLRNHVIVDPNLTDRGPTSHVHRSGAAKSDGTAA